MDSFSYSARKLTKWTWKVSSEIRTKWGNVITTALRSPCVAVNSHGLRWPVRNHEKKKKALQAVGLYGRLNGPVCSALLSTPTLRIIFQSLGALWILTTFVNVARKAWSSFRRSLENIDQFVVCVGSPKILSLAKFDWL